MRHIEVPLVGYEKLTNATPDEPSHAIRDPVATTHQYQREKLELLKLNYLSQLYIIILSPNNTDYINKSVSI